MATACASIPVVAVKKNLAVSDLLKARRSVPRPPRWSALVCRGFALVSSRLPQLRQCFVSFPTPHLYEHPSSVASMAINRTYQDEPAVFFGLVQEPENLGLTEIGGRVQQFVDGPLLENGSFRRLIRNTKLPRPMRRLLWWYCVSASGRQKSKILGTFAVNSIASMGMEVCQFISPVTTMLYYLPPSGSSETLSIQLAFDHRVYDGSLASEALVQLESVLNREIANEILGASTHPVSYTHLTLPTICSV